MRPRDFSNQWLESFIAAIFRDELSHVPEVLDRKTAHAGEILPQVSDDGVTDPETT